MYCIPISRGPSYFGRVPVGLARTYGIRRYYCEYYSGNIPRDYLVAARDQTRVHAVICVASYILLLRSIPAGMEPIVQGCRLRDLPLESDCLIILYLAVFLS